jgi:ferredoxin-NADP reductase
MDERETGMPAEWPAQVLEIHDETPSTKTFRFERPDVPFTFRPGQFMAVRLGDVTDPRGDSRSFSISSSPTDKDGVTVTTRLGPSPFKQRLFRLREGEEVNLWGPFGNFVLEPTHPAVFLGGGIGVTPFRSMIRFAAAQRRDQQVVLLYSSRTAEEIVYRHEFEELAHRWSSFRPVLCVSRPTESKEQWSGRTGHVDAALIREELARLRDPVCYICGPPDMVQELHRRLREELDTPPSQIRTELFNGY